MSWTRPLEVFLELCIVLWLVDLIVLKPVRRDDIQQYESILKDNQDLTQMAISSFSETANEGVGFGLGFACTLDSVTSGSIVGSDWYWGGAYSTIFWVDAKEDLAVVFMTQLMPSATFNFRGQLKSIIYAAIDG